MPQNHQEGRPEQLATIGLTGTCLGLAASGGTFLIDKFVDIPLDVQRMIYEPTRWLIIGSLICVAAGMVSGAIAEAKDKRP